MTENEALRLLRLIGDLAMIGYPYPDDAPPITAELILALGEIAGMSRKTLADYQRRQQDQAGPTHA